MFHGKYLPYLVLVFAVAGFAFGCAPDNKAKTTPNQSKPKERVSKLTSPKNGAQYIHGDAIPVEVKVDSTSDVKADSIVAYMEGVRLAKLEANKLSSVTINRPFLGSRKLQVTTYKSDGKKEIKIANMLILSAVKPQIYRYELIKEYPHNTGSYTQGLLYHEGALYESTGQRGESRVMKVDLESGDLLQVHDMPKQYFGEGLTVLNDNLIQITWQLETGFVYDLESFEILRSFPYTGEGWGIATDGEKLIMSNGSNEISFLDPNSYKVVKTIKVVDHKGPVDKLNELEYINGEIWANYYEYQTFKIVRIDPESGQVNSYVNLTGILDTKDMHPGIDVMNGIAYDVDGDRLFVTGKYWPKLYEIRVLD